MTKISDTTIRTRDAALQDHIDEIVNLWNRGQIGFSFTSNAPSDTPDDYEIRIFNSGATYRIYVYFVNDGWKFVNLS